MFRSPRLLRATVLAVPALLGGACTGPTTDAPRSLVLIVIDTLRADHLGCYGYAFDTSPTLDSLAAAGVRFEQANTAAPITLPSITSLITGCYPRTHGVRDNGFFALSDGFQTLAERFRESGFRTGAVIGSAVIGPDRGVAQGFETYDAEFAGPYPTWDPSLQPLAEDMATNRRRAGVVTDRAIGVAQRFDGDPFFLFVHYFDVHHHYDPPPEFAALHPGRRYDGEIAYVDREISRLLQEVPGREHALVVIAGDHGEALGDHGEPEHGFLLHEATLRVPLIVSGPGVPAAAVRPDPVSLVDLEPTIGRLFGLLSDDRPRDGHAIDWETVEEPRPLYGETFRTLVSYGWSELRSVRLGDWKLVRGKVDELYQLARDPHENEPLPHREPYAQLATMLDDASRDDDPRDVYAAAHGTPDPQSAEMLESLGYASVDSRPFPKDPPDPRDELPHWLDRQIAKVFVREAYILLRKDRVEQAFALLDSSLARDPENATAYVLRGTGYMHLRNIPAARSAYEKCIGLDPAAAPAYKMLARIAMSEKDTGLALERWRDVLRIQPEDVDALRFVSGAHVADDEMEEAVPLLRTLVRLEPADVEAHYQLGVAARRGGRSIEARRHFERVLELAPDHAYSVRIREWLATAPEKKN